jgi:hypothetical protein
MPVVLKWSMVACGVVGCGAALTASCSPKNEDSGIPVCVGVEDGSIETLPLDGGGCPDGDIRTVV